jgi:hypothetical protein
MAVLATGARCARDFIRRREAMKWESAAACAAALVMSVACAETKAPAPAASTAPAATVAPATTAPAVAAASEYGVPECDTFMKAWAACVDSKVPADMRPAFKASFDEAKKSYTQAASTPQGKATLATVCTQQQAATKQALAAYSCSW